MLGENYRSHKATLQKPFQILNFVPGMDKQSVKSKSILYFYFHAYIVYYFLSNLNFVHFEKNKHES